MPSPDELIRLHDQICTLGLLVMERLKSPDEYGDLTMVNSDFIPLKFIAGQEGMSQAALSRMLRRTKGATSLIVNKLEDWGLVERVRSDNRCRLYLTEKGQWICREKRMRELRTAYRAMEEMPLEQDDLDAANRVLKELIIFCRQDALLKKQREDQKSDLSKCQ